MDDLTVLPPNLPVPTDDGAADHLLGSALPELLLMDSNGDEVRLGDPEAGRTVVLLYPMTGPATQGLPDGWDLIPGARGCTP